MEDRNIITYPFTTNVIYKDKLPFIRAITKKHVYYGYELKHLILIDLNNKDTILIFNTYQKPNEIDYNILRNATNKLRGITYKLLYVNNYQYLCLGISNSNDYSLVIIDIELNSKGHYEIQGIKDILKEK